MKRSTWNSFWAFSGCVSLFLGAQVAQADEFWDGEGADNNWSTSGNWSSGLTAGVNAIFNNTDPTTAGVINNVVDADISLNSLTYQQTLGNRHVTEIAEDVTLTLSGTTTPFPGDSPYQTANSGTSTSSNVFRIGTYVDSASTATVATHVARVEIRGAGSFEIDSAANNVVISSFSINSGNTNTTMAASVTLDMSGLAAFEANVTNFWVGTGRASNATVHLADANTITAAQLVIGRTLWRVTPTGAVGTPSLSTVYLGTTNTINTGVVQIGAESGSSNAARNSNSGAMQFADGLENATLTLRAQDGINRVAAMQIGSVGTVNDSTPGVNLTGVADFTGGSVDAMVTDLQVGFGRPAVEGNSSTGTLKISAGTFDATTVRVGYGTGGSNTGGGPRGTVTGNLDISGGTFVAGTLAVATKAATNIRSVVVGNVNLSGGTLSSGNITLGNHGYLSTFPNDATATGTLTISGTGVANVSGTILEGTAGTAAYNRSTVNVTGGTLNMTGATKTVSVDALNVGSAGTLTGLTTFGGGRFDLDGDLTTTSLSVSSAARIGGDGEITGNLALASGALFVFSVDSTLAVSGTVTLDSSFGVASLVNADGTAIDWASVNLGEYKLIDTSSSFAHIQNYGVANGINFGGGRVVYFGTDGLTVHVPEPGSAMGLLVLAGGLIKRRSRRKDLNI